MVVFVRRLTRGCEGVYASAASIWVYTGRAKPQGQIGRSPRIVVRIKCRRSFA